MKDHALCYGIENWNILLDEASLSIRKIRREEKSTENTLARKAGNAYYISGLRTRQAVRAKVTKLQKFHQTPRATLHYGLQGASSCKDQTKRG